MMPLTPHGIPCGLWLRKLDDAAFLCDCGSGHEQYPQKLTAVDHGTVFQPGGLARIGAGAMHILIWRKESEVETRPVSTVWIKCRAPDTTERTLHGTQFRSTGSGEKRDRKSTRLNSSHQLNSYAVFCLK